MTRSAAARSGPGIALEPVTERPIAPWQPADPPGATLRARNFRRELDLQWRRTSYSALTAAAHGVAGTVSSVGSEPEPSKEDDEATGDAPGPVAPPSPEVVAAGPDPFAAPSPMQALPMGAAFGTLVHEVFELVDPVAADLDAEIHRACAVALARTPAEGVTVDDLAAGLTPAYRTPLGPLATDRRLCDLPPVDRLAELTFEFGAGRGRHHDGRGHRRNDRRRAAPAPARRRIRWPATPTPWTTRCSPARCCAAT